MAWIYKELEEAGFGIRRLRLLRDTIKEIAAEHKIPETVAAENLFRDIEENYDRKIGYQCQIREGIEELNSLGLVLSFKMEVAKDLGKLTSMGYHEHDSKLSSDFGNSLNGRRVFCNRSEQIRAIKASHIRAIKASN